MIKCRALDTVFQQFEIVVNMKCDICGKAHHTFVKSLEQQVCGSCWKSFMRIGDKSKGKGPLGGPVMLTKAMQVIAACASEPAN